jgi:hypothetical protein
LGLGESRRGSASGVAAVIMAIMVVAIATSGAVIYYSRGGTSPTAGISSPSGAGLSGALSNPDLSNLTSALGGLSGDLSNSTLSRLTAALDGTVQVAGSSLPAAEFTDTGTTSTFTCSAYPSEAYVALTDNGTGSASVTSISIASPVGVTTFTPSGLCDIDAAGSGGGPTYIIFPATSQLSPSPLQGSYYAGAVSMSDGSEIPFAGVWQ